VSDFRRNFWLPAVRAANLDGLRIHDLRHTAVALWIAAGASPKEVAQRAGHTSVSFVLDRYGHLFPEADTALRARLDDLFRAVTEHRRNTASLETGTAPLACSASGAVSCWFANAPAVGLEPTTLALTGPRSAD
jgi:hypothetical protein